MNENMIYEIIIQLNEISPIRAKKLLRLANDYFSEEDPTLKNKLRKVIRQYVYDLYLNCLAKETRKDVVNTGVQINDFCYDLETSVNGLNARYGWFIFFDGARQIKRVNGEDQVTGFIPRTYKRGFNLGDNSTKTEIEFLRRKKSILEDISLSMDHKQELTSNYKIKNKRIPKEFVELLIDYLGLERVPTKKQIKSQV